MDKNLEILKQSTLFSILCFGSALFGMKFPDVDLSLSIQYVIHHRSVFTHSILIAWVIYYLAKRDIHPKYLKPIAAGLAIGIAIHLSFDAFPKGWRGFAFIYAPFIKTLKWVPYDGDSLPIVFTLSWILGNIIGSLWVIEKIIKRDSIKWAIVGAISATVFLTHFQVENRFIGPLLVITICCVLYFYRRDIFQKFPFRKIKN